jgi:hypothetical protein
MDFTHAQWMADGDAMCVRGFADARAGQGPASEHPFYGEAHIRGDLMRKAGERNLVLALSYATRCECCACMWDGHGDNCRAGCDNGRGTARLQHGLFCVHGPYDPGEPPLFLSTSELRAMIGAGQYVYNHSGDCINPEILIQ